MVSVLAVSVTFTDRDYALIQVIQDGFPSSKSARKARNWASERAKRLERN